MGGYTWKGALEVLAPEIPEQLSGEVFWSPGLLNLKWKVMICTQMYQDCVKVLHGEVPQFEMVLWMKMVSTKMMTLWMESNLKIESFPKP